MRALVLAAVATAAALASGAASAAAERPARLLHAEVVGRVPHDAAAFTQGLVFSAGRLYESTGLYGSSTLRELDPRTGRVLRRRALSPRLFGEGLAAVGPRLVQLTWKEGVAEVWDARRLRRERRFRYAGEGWGLCYDGRRLVQSDGSARLTFRDPATFAVRGGVEVRLDRSFVRLGLVAGPVRNLNELECAGGAVYANVWKTDAVLVIDPRDGRVDAVVDASALPRPRLDPAEDVLNGIAFDPARRAFLLTGKRWPWLYRVRFVSR